MRLRWIIAFMLMIASCSGGPAGDRIVVAAGTTIVDSGFLEAVVAAFEQSAGGRPVSVVAAATGQALTLADGGAVDVTITHNRSLEDAFVNEHEGTTAVDVFASTFVLVGPPHLAGELDGVDLLTAVSLIVDNGWPFVARADGSGTSEREMSLWVVAGVHPDDDRYIETGLGMGETLQIAGTRQAFTLSEAGAFVAADVSGLVAVALAPDGLLANPYRAIALNDAATEFVAWLQSDSGAAAILAADALLFDHPIYVAP